MNRRAIVPLSPTTDTFSRCLGTSNVNDLLLKPVRAPGSTISHVYLSFDPPPPPGPGPTRNASG